MAKGLCGPCSECLKGYLLDRYEVDRQDDGAMRPRHDGSGGIVYHWRADSIDSCYLCYHLVDFWRIHGVKHPEQANLRLGFSSSVLGVWDSDQPSPNRPWPHFHFAGDSIPRAAKFSDGTKLLVDEARSPSRNIWSQETILHAREWLKECLTNNTNGHENCRSDTRPGRSLPLPRRLLRVANDSGVWRATLQESKDLTDTDKVRYISVSHRWGTAKFLVLTSNNYGSFKVAIPLHDPSFKKSFLDVFQVVVDLGYHYVWIGSLCIIQDDFGDWVEQCPLMADIYRGADLNISVAGSVHSRGILGQRQSLFANYRPEIEFPKGKKFYLVEDCHYEDEIQSSPLFSRGWIVQERFLVRILPPELCSDNELIGLNLVSTDSILH
ncbi:heterokaryon incompatibility protein-domain-containing protein [Xylaria venustula]|nr:heterokaryon incompatibility protein-domain-containing protein [Xylaria venustula]